jgi:hypothetical protein
MPRDCIGLFVQLICSTLSLLNVLTSWIKTGGGQLSSPLTFSNIIMAILWGNTLITFENDIIDTNGWNYRIIYS